MITVSRITLDYEETLRCAVKMPQFGWVIESSERNCVQTAYQLQISEEPDFASLVYDSGRVADRDSQHIVPQFAMKSLTPYYYRVRVECGEEQSCWSGPGSFCSGVMDNAELTGAFVSAETDADAHDSKGTYVRGGFSARGGVKRATIVCSALGLYQAFLNGKRIGCDEMAPGFTSYHKRLLYQVYDVTELIAEGENAVGALLGPGWYKGRFSESHAYNLYGTKTAFFCQLQILYADGTCQTVVSDETWMGTDAPVVFAEIYAGETYDARKEIKNWCCADVDLSDWCAVSVVPVDKTILKPHTAAIAREHECFPTKEILTTPKGETVVDFGQNLAGWVHIRANGKKGDVISLDCFEILDKDGCVYRENLLGADQHVEYIFGEDGQIDYHPHFSTQGFRYIHVRSFPGTVTKDVFSAVAVYSDMVPTGVFTCSDPRVERLVENARWVMKSNSLYIPSDCPQRDERQGWTGDAELFQRTASYLANTYGFYQSWLTDMALDQDARGAVSHAVPDVLTGHATQHALDAFGSHGAIGWADACTIVPWNLYLNFGDREILRRQLPCMKKWIGYLKNHREIWENVIQFGDWLGLHTDVVQGAEEARSDTEFLQKEKDKFGPTPTILTDLAFAANSAQIVIRACKILGVPEEAAEAEGYLQEVKREFAERFFDADGEMTVQTQTAYVLALSFDLVPPTLHEKTVEGLCRQIRLDGGYLTTGLLGTAYVLHALSQNGCGKLAYELFLRDQFPSWLYEVENGATTVWERWNGRKPDGTFQNPEMNSFNHPAFGSFGDWVFRACIGIEADSEQPGFRHILLRPQIGPLQYVQGSYDSIYGKIAVRWETCGDTVRLSVEIPANTTATLQLDGCQAIISADGAEFDGTWQAQLGSGCYQIEYQYQ